MLNRLVGCALALLVLSACQPPNPQPDEVTVAAAEAQLPPPHEALDPLDTDGGKRIILAIRAYNYSSRDIDFFTVNGDGGGGVKSGAGGGMTCCSSIPKDVDWDLLEFKVRWVAGGCMRKMRFSNGEPYETTEYFYKEKLVRLKEPLPEKANNVEVHFYPGERIEVAITELSIGPRIPASDIKEDLTPYPPCEEKTQ